MKPIHSFAAFSVKSRSIPGFVRTIVAAICACGFFACVCALTSLRAQDYASPVHTRAAAGMLLPGNRRKSAPDFSLTDARAERITLSNYKGKVVLLDFWATWCGGCKREIPWYIEFDRRYRQQDLAVIGVSMDDAGWKVVRPFLAAKIDKETGGNMEMDYPVVIGNGELAKEYNLTSMPMTLLIDREGRIALSHTGVVNKEDFERDIRQLLN